MQALSADDNTSLSGGTILIGPDENHWDQTNSDADVLRTRAVWQLNELVFHNSESGIKQNERRLYEAYNEERQSLFKIYHERQILFAKFKSHSFKSPALKAQTRASLQAYTEYLNALTDNNFAEQWLKP